MASARDPGMQVPRQEYLKMVDSFIQAANGMKDDGKDINVVANALMEASAVYATFVSVGNKGYLKETGVAKLADAYRDKLARVQAVKKAAAESESAEGQATDS